jgi:2'-5' RNA ligase
MEEIRSFIAIELPDDLRQRLGQLEARLKSGRQSGVKWVDPNGIHLTLKFLGNIVTDTIAKVTVAIEEAAQGIPPFRLEVRDLGVFPNLKRVQVAWVGVDGEIDKLARLQKRIESSLEPLGFAPESRPFTAHLTIARIRNDASLMDRQTLGQLITSVKFEGSIVNVDSISLMKSQLTREGAIYSRISLVSLNKGSL